MIPGPRVWWIWTGWILAVLLSGALNLFLFSVMPAMIRSMPDGPEKSAPVSAIQVMRVKRPEPLPPELPARKPEHRTPKKSVAKHPVKNPLPKPTAVSPSLPFELHPKLPKMVHSLEMPPLETFSMETPQIKDQYLAHELDTGLIPLVKVPPIYPLSAARRGIKGWVKVQFRVNRSGWVEDIQILAAEPEKVFDKSVIDCVSQWQFKPGRVEGVPVAALAQTTIRFQLK